MSSPAPMPPYAEILSIGMVTPIGASAAQTAASVRAGIARLSESYAYDQHGEPITLGMIDDENLPPLCDALEEADLEAHRRRLLRIAGPALREAMGIVREPIPVFLGAPEARSNGEQSIDVGLLDQISVQTECAIDLPRSRVLPHGRAAGLLALASAIRIVRRGDAPFIMVGGLDSYVDEATLAALDEDGRLKNGEVQDGFVPGEGAAFVLVGRAGSGARFGMPPLARILGVGLGREPGHLYSSEPYRGDGLAQAFAALFEAVPPNERVRTLYAGLNGENFWAKELGVARIRNKERFEEPLRVEHPADAFGDAGAALGPVMVGLAVHALHHGYRPGPALVYCGSDREERVAVMIAA